MAIRPARAEDAERVLVWRNDPVTIAQSFSRHAISAAEHLKWWTDSLAHAARDLWIAEVDGAPVGHFRVDIEAEVGEVGVVVAPEARGRGLCAPIVRGGSEASLERHPRLAELVALIRPLNRASARCFERAGYWPRPMVVVGESEALRYVYRPDGWGRRL